MGVALGSQGHHEPWGVPTTALERPLLCPPCSVTRVSPRCSRVPILMSLWVSPWGFLVSDVLLVSLWCLHVPKGVPTSLFSSCPHDVPVVVPCLHGSHRCVPMVSLWCSHVPMDVPAAFPWVSPCSSDVPMSPWVSPWCPLPCPTCPPWSAARCWRPSALRRFWGVQTVPGTVAVPDISRDVGDVGGIWGDMGGSQGC